MSNNPKKFIGVGLPMINSQYGYFNPTMYTRDQIRSNIKNLILTQTGQRLMNVQFGTGLNKLLFQNADAQTGRAILTQIQQSIKK